MTLTEKYRPRTLSEVVAQPKAIAALERIRKRSGTFAGRAYWVSGPSGCGKSTIAEIVAKSVEGAAIVRHAADCFGAEEMRDLAEQIEMLGRSLPGFGLACIIDEAHGLRAPIIRQLLVAIERIEALGANAVIIFTTTKEGEEEMFEDSIEQHPLLHRCAEIRVTSQGAAKPFAARAAEIARAEGIELTEEDALKLAYKAKCSMRGILRAIETAA